MREEELPQEKHCGQKALPEEKLRKSVFFTFHEILRHRDFQRVHHELSNGLKAEAHRHVSLFKQLELLVQPGLLLFRVGHDDSGGGLWAGQLALLFRFLVRQNPDGVVGSEHGHLGQVGQLERGWSGLVPLHHINARDQACCAHICTSKTFHKTNIFLG